MTKYQYECKANRLRMNQVLNMLKCMRKSRYVIRLLSNGYRNYKLFSQIGKKLVCYYFDFLTGKCVKREVIATW